MTNVQKHGDVFCTYMIEKGLRSAFEYIKEFPKKDRNDILLEGSRVLLIRHPKLVKEILHD